MRTLHQIISEHFNEYTSKDLEVMETVRNETVDDLKHRLWDVGCDVAKVAEAISAFKRENPK